MKRKWRTRKRGTKRQVGKPFLTESTQGMKSKLPKITANKASKLKIRFDVDRLSDEEKSRTDIRDTTLQRWKLKDLVGSEGTIKDLEKFQFPAERWRISKLRKKGVTVPVIVIDRHGNIIDGHHRWYWAVKDYGIDGTIPVRVLPKKHKAEYKEKIIWKD